MQPSVFRITPGDPKLESEGIWVNYHGVELKIARSNTDAYLRGQRDETVALRESTGSTEMTDEQAREITTRLLAKHVLVGWRGFQYDGKDVPYNEENAQALLRHDRDALEFVSNYSARASNFARQEAERIGKKSSDGPALVDALEHEGADEEAALPASATG